MICREEQEDTLKSLRLVPVDEAKLTVVKAVKTKRVFIKGLHREVWAGRRYSEIVFL